MTNEEALKMTIRECNYFEELSRDANGKGCRDKGECKDCYANFVIKSLEKQIPKKPIKNSEYKDESWSRQATLCPDCKGYLCGLPNHCRDCGRKLDWSDYE